MATSETPADLVETFRKLGVSDPQGWADSEFREGIDQTARATLLRALADSAIRSCRPAVWRKSTRSAEMALNKLTKQGADLDAVQELCIQSAYMIVWEFLRMSSRMDEPELNPADLSWAIVRLDPNGELTGEIEAPYESWWEVLCDVRGRDPSDI